LLDRNGTVLNQLPIPSEDAAYPKGPLAFSPTQQTLAVGAQGFATPAVELLDGRTLDRLPRQLHHQPRAPSLVADIDFSGDGKHLAVSYNHESSPPHEARWSIRIWDLATPAAAPKVIASVGEPVNQIAMSDDGRRVFASWPVRGYDVRTGRMLFRDAKTRSFNPIDLNAAGTTLALGVSYNNNGLPPFNQVRLVDARTGDLTGKLQVDDDRNTAVGATAFSHDGSLLAVATQASALQVWDTHGHSLLFERSPLQVSALAFGADDDTLFTAGGDGVVRAWDLTGRRALISRLPLPSRTAIGGLAVPSPNGSTLAVDTWRTRRDFVDVDSGRLFRANGDVAGWPLANSEPDGSAWSPDGRVYAVGGTDRFPAGGSGGLVELYSQKGHLLDSFAVSAPVTGLSFVPDGSRLVVAELSGRVDVLDASSLANTPRTFRVDGHPCCVVVGPTGDRAAVLTTADEVAPGSSPRWNQWSVIALDDGSVISSGSFHDRGALDVAFSPDSRRLAFGLSDGTLSLVDAETGAELNHPVPRLGNAVDFVAFDPTGARIASSSTDGSLSLWDGRTGKLVEAVSLDRSGQPVFLSQHKLLIASDDVGSYIWDPDVNRLDGAACLMSGRNLTRDEWASYLPGRPYQKTCPAHN
jgi:WD40 repeat protein